MMDRRTFVTFAILLTMALWTGSGHGEPAEDGGRISGLVMGHLGFVWHDSFRILFIRDPLFTYTIYPLPPDLGDGDKRKLDRVYYPRTGQSLVESYDLLVFHDARFQHFTARQVHDLDHAFREAGMSSVMVFMGSFLWDWVLQPTILGEVVPISGHTNARYGAFWVNFRRDRDPVFLPFLEFGVEKVVGNAIAEMRVKQGATVWADMFPQDQPWLVSWRPGGGDPGMQWVLIQWYLEGWWDEENNPYALDVAANLILYSMRRPLISDIQARREARRLFTSIQSQKSVMLSMMEWADAFGANTLTLAGRLRELEDEMQGAVEDYIEQDYAPAISFLDSLTRSVDELTKDAVRLKDEVLFWAFVVEWLAVTGMGLVSGFLVWTLMIRRRYYREVGATRLGMERRI